MAARVPGVGAQKVDVVRPNVLWIVPEDMGQDFSCYGEPAVSTPNVDKLAAEGVRFDRAFCTSPVCSPARSALCTGMYAPSIGAHNHRTKQQDAPPLPPDVKLVSHQFAEAGYQTVTLGSRKEDWNFQHPKDAWMFRNLSDIDKSRPFFAMMSIYAPHRATWDKWPALPHPTDPATVVIPPQYPDTAQQRDSYAKYLDCVVEADRQVGEIVKQLEELGVLDNTIIFCFGDNGRTMYADKRWCYEGGLTVPMVARFPKRFAAGTSSDDLVSLIDLLPTCLSMCGIPPAARTQGVVMKLAGGPGRQYVYGSRDRLDEVVDCIRSARDQRFKYIRNYIPEVGFVHGGWTRQKYPEYAVAGKLATQGQLTPLQARHFLPTKPPEELYDLAYDKSESTNLADRPGMKSVLDRLRGELDLWLAEIKDQGIAGLEKARAQVLNSKPANPTSTPADAGEPK